MTTNGKYKIELSPREKLTEDNTAVKMLEQLTTIRQKLSQCIARHNFLIDLREELATTPWEYIKNDVHNMSDEDNRYLLVKGCTAEIDDLANKIKGIKVELNETMFLQ